MTSIDLHECTTRGTAVHGLGGELRVGECGVPEWRVCSHARRSALHATPQPSPPIHGRFVRGPHSSRRCSPAFRNPPTTQRRRLWRIIDSHLTSLAGAKVALTTTSHPTCSMSASGRAPQPNTSVASMVAAQPPTYHSSVTCPSAIRGPRVRHSRAASASPGSTGLSHLRRPEPAAAAAARAERLSRSRRSEGQSSPPPPQQQQQ